MDPTGVLHNIFLFIMVPILGIVVVAAIESNRVKTAIMAVLALVVGAAFVFMPAGTIEALGRSAAAGLSSFLSK